MGRDTNSMPLFPIYQSDELPIQPPEHIGSLLWLCPEHSKPCHQDCCSLLVKCCFYVPQLTLRICPTDNCRVSATLLIRGYQRLDLCSDPVLCPRQCGTTCSLRKFRNHSSHPQVLSEGQKHRRKTSHNPPDTTVDTQKVKSKPDAPSSRIILTKI